MRYDGGLHADEDCGVSGGGGGVRVGGGRRGWRCALRWLLLRVAPTKREIERRVWRVRWGGRGVEGGVWREGRAGEVIW